MQGERDLPKVKEQVSGRPEIRLVFQVFPLLFTTKGPASLLLGTIPPDGIYSTQCHSVLGVSVTTSSTLKQPFGPPLKGTHFFLPMVWNTSPSRKWWLLEGYAEKNRERVRAGHSTRASSAWLPRHFLEPKNPQANSPLPLWSLGIGGT